jgi:hypothetical protein
VKGRVDTTYIALTSECSTVITILPLEYTVAKLDVYYLPHYTLH